MRQTEKMEADSTAAIHRTDASAVAVHEALVELTLHKKLELGLLRACVAVYCLVVSNASKAVDAFTYLIKRKLLSDFLASISNFLERIILEVFNQFAHFIVGDLLRQQRNVHEIVRTVG